MDLTTLTPTEIDTVLAAIYGRRADVAERLTYAHAALRQYREDMARARRGEPGYSLSIWNTDGEHTYQAKIRYLTKMVTDLSDEAAPYHAEFTRRGGWTRFFAVLGGHVHSSMDCPTCNKDGKLTRFGWLPEWSGRTEDEALEALVSQSAKTVLCSVCFPSAPVAWTKPRQDPAVCSGSGKGIDRSLPSRLGYYAGNWVTCQDCGAQVAATNSSLRVRKHKR